ncbi:MAG: hypothetical protein ACYDDA_13630 [Acidiferrobacteraceae bacterium]
MRSPDEEPSLKPIPLSDVTAAAAALKQRRVQDTPRGTLSRDACDCVVTQGVRAPQGKGYTQSEILTVLHAHHIETPPPRCGHICPAGRVTPVTPRPATPCCDSTGSGFHRSIGRDLRDL